MKHVFRRFTGEFRAQILIGRDVKHPRLRTVGNRRPILAAPQAWTEPGGLVGAGFARLVDVRPPCLRVANAGIAASRVPELSKNSVDATGLILPRKGSSSGLRTLFGTLLGHWRRPALKSLAYFAPHIAASWDARRLARRLACRVISAFTRVLTRYGTPHGCSAEHPNVSRRSAHPSFGVSEAKSQTPGAKMRRGNEMGCLTS
jgi:hypothetical protein